MRQIVLPDGTHVPALMQGTWNIAERADTRAEEIATLRDGVERGLTLIDTAEMYADGRSEELVGQVIACSSSPRRTHTMPGATRCRARGRRGSIARYGHDRPLPASLARERVLTRDGRGNGGIGRSG